MRRCTRECRSNDRVQVLVQDEACRNARSDRRVTLVVTWYELDVERTLRIRIPLLDCQLSTVLFVQSGCRVTT